MSKTWDRFQWLKVYAEDRMYVTKLFFRLLSPSCLISHVFRGCSQLKCYTYTSCRIASNGTSIINFVSDSIAGKFQQLISRHWIIKKTCKSKVVRVSTMTSWECGGCETIKFRAVETLTLEGSERYVSDSTSFFALEKKKNLLVGGGLTLYVRKCIYLIQRSSSSNSIYYTL